MRYIVLNWLVLVLCTTTFAQTRTITGVVKEINGPVLSNVSVTLSNESGIILLSSYTNEQGKYSLIVPDSLTKNSNLFVRATYLGYKKSQLQLSPNVAVYDLILENDPIQLSEVKIKNKPIISKSGDTLSYDVNSFARSEDRNVGDVIKRLPGFTVEDDGRILYNGQAISNLYTGGDDLMGGKYGLATKSISKDMISKIEVIKNHQPIKVLKDKVLTNDIAVNLVLKDENTLRLSGEGMIGGGMPSQFDASGNLIALSKALKMVNVLKTNNSGVDYRSFTKNLSSSSGFGSGSFSKPNFLTSNGTIGPPSLPTSNYYVNRSGLLSLNNLINTKKEWQVRLSAQVFLDKNNLEHFSNVVNYIANDTIIYSERQSVNQKTNLFNTNVFLSKNTYSQFTNNELNLSLKRDWFASPMSLNGLGFNQQLKNEEYEITNRFSYIPRLKGSTVMGVNWNMTYFTNPQLLNINEGLNAELINNGIPYSALIQEARIPTFFSTLNFAYIIPNHLIKQNYQLGLNNEFKELNSHVSIVDLNGYEVAYGGDAGNALKWQNHKIDFNPSYQLKTELWQISLNIPIQEQLINYKQRDYQLNKNFNQLSLNPNASVNFKTGAENYLSTSFGHINNVGDISSVYRGNLLTNYRTLKKNTADLQVKRSWNVALKYHIEKSIKLMFANVGFNYSESIASSIAFTTLLNNVQTTVLVPIKNKSKSFSLNSEMSKQFIPINTKIQLTASYNNLRTNLFINDELLPYVNSNFIATFSYDTKLMNALSINHNIRYNYSKGAQGNGGNSTFNFRATRIDNFLSLIYNLNGKLILEANGQYLFNQLEKNATSRLFLINSGLKYRFSKPKIELNFDVTNLLDEKKYTTISIAGNQQFEGVYNLRGRMAILRLSYMF